MATPKPKKLKLKKGQILERNNSLLGTSGIQLGKNDDDSFLELKLLEETQHLQNIFPEEIWLLVINQLNDSHEDMKRVTNASPYFRKLLLPKRVFFLLPDVLSAILPELLFDQEEYEDQADSDWDSEEGCIPYKADDIYKRQTGIIMNFRFVCSMWSKMVDFYMREFSVSDGNGFMQSKTENCYYADKRSTKILCHFLRHFERTHPSNSKRSPFVQKTVEIDYLRSGVSQQQLLTNKLTILFQKYGHHIFDFVLRTPPNFPYAKLKEWLQLMRNLQSFQIENDSLGGQMSINELTQLDIKVRENPLPRFHKLQNFHTNSTPRINQEIIRQSRHLSTIYINPRSREEQRVAGYEFFALPLPKLESVELYCCTQKDIVKISQSQNVASWPLKSLKLLEWDKEDFISWTTIFQVIQDKWGATLETLSLHLPVTKNNCEMLSILQDSHTFRLNLPKLRTVELKCSHPTHLDFLLPMKESLESLYINIRCSTENQITRKDTSKQKNTIIPVIQFVGYENNILKSNIWTLFPYLKSFSLSGDHYSNCTRKEWRKLQ